MYRDDYGEMREALVRTLVSSGYITSEEVKKTFLAVPRELFVPEHLRARAYVDVPLPIGHGQTISAPSMIAIMLEALNLGVGQKVLEVGAGSGYNAALVYELVRKRVFTVERIPELVDFARSNLEATGYSGKVEVVLGDGTLGYEEEKPYDRILVTAGAPDIPQPLVDQLADGGIVGIPVGKYQAFQEFVTVTKMGNNLKRRSYGGCAFVPLVGRYGWKERW